MKFSELFAIIGSLLFLLAFTLGSINFPFYKPIFTVGFLMLALSGLSLLIEEATSRLSRRPRKERKHEAKEY